MPHTTRYLVGAASASLVAALLPAALLAGEAHATSVGGALTQPPAALGPAGQPRGTARSLTSVSADSVDDRWAIGRFDVPGATHTWIERFDGTHWTHVPSPNTSHRDTQLNGVYAAASDDVWAVGLYDDQGPSLGQALIMHWDGQAWTQTDIEEPGSYSTLEAVSGSGPNDIYAVGQVYDGRDRALVMHFDGTSWKRMNVPLAPSEALAGARAVTVLSPTNIWSVGYADYGQQSYLPYVAHYDGSGWTFPSLPSMPEEAYLFGVSGSGPNDVWAVGRWFQTYPYSKTFAFHWNGHAWSQVSTPNGAGSSNSLDDVATLSPTNAWAVGWAGLGRSSQTLITHWDGTAWTQVSSPNANLRHNALYSVAAVSGTDISAVGGSFIHHKGRSLLEQWDGTDWTLAD